MLTSNTIEEQELIDNANLAMETYKQELVKKGFNQHHVIWVDLRGNKYGKGILTLKDKIYLLKCPACHKENCAINVSSGICTWCPFDANYKKGYRNA
jgi:hypothetical protein